jgi:hypothetical protein
MALFLATFLQFLSSSFLASSLTPSSHLSLGLPLCLLPSTTATRTLLAGFCSFSRMTYPALTVLQGGSNMTGTVCVYTSHSLSRSCLNHLVFQLLWADIWSLCLWESPVPLALPAGRLAY